MPDMLETGAFSAGTRWRRLEPVRFGANHLTLYDVSDHSVDDAVRISRDAMTPLVARGRKLECHVSALTVTLLPSARYGAAGLRAD